MKKILIIGCGELGSRFLQACLSIDIVSAIDIIEPNSISRNTAASRANEINPSLTEKIGWYNSISEITSSYDLCIIATHADVREAIIEKVINLGIKSILTEKIVTQSIESYVNILNLAKTNNVTIWVNCKTRAYSIWKYVKERLNPAEQLSYYSIGGAHGLCTNGLHAIDLFVHITECKQLIDQNSVIDTDLMLTKRNKYDLTGTFNMVTENNSKCTIAYLANSYANNLEIVATPSYRWIIDYSAKQIFESSVENNWKMEPLIFEENNLSVSHMSIRFISDILKKNDCELPTIADTFIAHRYIYEVSLPIFNASLKKSDNICPIT